jgi:hypothetical protein
MGRPQHSDQSGRSHGPGLAWPSLTIVRLVPKWEYATLTVEIVRDVSGGVHAYADGQKVGQADDAADAYGDDGWELVSVAHIGSLLVYHFKRPRE